MTDSFKQKRKNGLSCRTRSGIQAFKTSGFRLDGRNDKRRSFTLIELLVVLALVAILSVVVILTLNPAELLKQARDSNRLSDLATVNTSLNLFSSDVINGFMGTSSIVYISIPDSSPTCANLGLPTSTSFTYSCVSSANLRKTDGTGWIPVNFQRISSNSPISQLPIDPVNTTSSGNYYTYVTGGSWMLTAIPESQKQKTELSNNPHLSKFPGVIGLGNNLDISPLYNPNGLVGYWKFDEGSGTVAKDSSGNNYNGSLNNFALSGSISNWYTGKITTALAFDGNNDYVQIPYSSGLDLNIYSLSVWFKTSTGDGVTLIDWNGFITNKYRLFVGVHSGKGTIHKLTAEMYSTDGSHYTDVTSSVNIDDGAWHQAAEVFNGSSLSLYIDGVLTAGPTNWQGGSISESNSLFFGATGQASNAFGNYFPGSIDDVRLYNRALSAAEILALYNATK